MRGLWGRVNRGARAGYRRLASRAPRTAAALKRALFPVLIAANRRLLRQDYPALFAPAATDRLRGRFQTRLTPGQPLVSVVVPNFNHGRFLRQRLDSIAAQTYGRREVILLDDASTDGSDAILREFAAATGARLIANAANSGGAFRQWQRGIEAATGELVWIAESDDWADARFLERLVPCFANPGVQLGFGRTVFMDAVGTGEVAAMEDQLFGVPPDIYAGAFVEPGFTAVRRGLGQVNLIPNAGAALFRRPFTLAAVEGELWRDLESCGDWMLYLNLLRGGMLAYEPGAVGYYRQHGANTSQRAHRGDRFYAEHEAVARCVARHFGADPAQLAALRERLAALWRAARAEPVAGLAALYDPARVMEEPRRLRLLMAGAGFSGGGAEVFAITLAALMREAGESVTFLDCGLEPEAPELRRRLPPEVPVLTDPAALPAIVAGFGIDVIHSHHAWVDQAVAAARGPAAHVATLHGMYETMPPAQRTRALARLVEAGTTLAAAAARNADGLPPGRVTVIDNAVASARVEPADRAGIGVPEGAFLIVLASRAVPEKGWAEAIEAVTRARAAAGRDIRLVLAGAGPMHDRVRAAGVPPFVHLLGFRGDVPALFAAADLALLPSIYAGESAPLSVLEALAAGTPVLASDLGRIGEMLGGAGEVFPLADGRIDIEGLTARIAALTGDAARLAAMRAAIPPAEDDAARMVAAYGALYRRAAVGA